MMAHPWKIIETAFIPGRVKAAESLFSLGNGRMGQRANFEEAYSGETLQGSYIGGVYYPDKTRVGWWKNGYPAYFAKVLNSAFWIGIDVRVDGETLDLHTASVSEFYRELDMQRGVLRRRFVAGLPGGALVAVEAVRFLSIARTTLGAISYTVTPLHGDADIELTPFTDAGVRNEDANYGEMFWHVVRQTATCDHTSVLMRTGKTNFPVCWHSTWTLLRDGRALDHRFAPLERPAWVGACVKLRARRDEPITLHKYTGICAALAAPPDAAGLAADARTVADDARQTGFAALAAEQAAAWAARWRRCDVEIGGDTTAQQGIRFCIFHLLQTYSGEDPRLNIGPKGFTGEKYGGGTYWDTEACCLPFYLSTSGARVARHLLRYRHRQLPQAIRNAETLGFTGGAALFPMVTMNGEECHNEWEITFEEIHRNGAIAFAIFNYIRYTGDRRYLATHGLEVLIGIARFWAQRVNWSAARRRYVILGVTGPNEYENNVNNNWYTNYIARWCLRYTRESMDRVKREHPAHYARTVARTGFDEQREWPLWDDIAQRMYLPCHAPLGIFLQQDGYLDKEQQLAADLDPAQRPLNQHWSWDRILRSCFIKQADVLQGLYFFEDDFDAATLRRNFRFYEARTVHESSLSPGVHAVLAAATGDPDKAYALFLRAARLDLDDYNREVTDGLHITSMAGAWLAVVQGFAGMRVRDGRLSFTPRLPKHWTHLSLRVRFRGKTEQHTFT
jgi:maltose phosphorylase